MIQNTAGQAVYFEARSLKDGTLVSGLSVSASLSLDGTAPVSSTNTVSEIGTTGRYQLLLSQSETNHYTLAVLLTTATADVFLPLIQADFTPVPDIPTVAQIQSGLAKTSELPDVSGLATLQNLTDSQTAIVSACATASGFATPADVPTVAQIWDGEVARNANNKIVSAQSVLSSLYTADPATFAKEASLSAIPTATQIAAGVWGYPSRTLTSSLSTLTAAEVWGYPSRTLTGSALNGGWYLASLQSNTGFRDYMQAQTQAVATLQTSVDSIPTVTYTVPTVAEIQEGLAKSTELPDVSTLATASSVAAVKAVVDEIPTQTYNVPTAAQIQEGLATSQSVQAVQNSLGLQGNSLSTISENVLYGNSLLGVIIGETGRISDLATASSVADVKTVVDAIPTNTYSVPTVAQIQSGLAKTSELPDVSGLATASSLAAVKTAVDAIPTETYTVPTVAQIQEGLATASSITTLQTSVDSIPTNTYTVPTVSQIQSGLAKTSELPDVSGLATAASVAEVKTVVDAIPKVTYNVPTVSQIQEGLAKTSELPDVSGLATAQAAAEIQAAVGLIPTVTYTVPTAEEIASAVVAKDFSGETFPLHSLAGGVCAHLHFAVGEESITVYGTDGETVLGRIPYTSAASAEPITGLGVSNE